MQCFGDVFDKILMSIFWTMFFKTQNIVRTMHLTMLDGFTALINLSNEGLEVVCLLRKKLIFGPDLISKVEEFVKCVCNDLMSDKNFGTI